MYNLCQSIIFGCIELFCIVFLIILLSVSSYYESWYFFSVTLLLSIIVVIIAALFAYQIWLMFRSPKVLVIGDKHVNNEKLITDYDTHLIDEYLSINIVPRAIIEQDSPRGRQVLKRLKGSHFSPPRLLITINIKQLLNSDDSELTLLSMNLNRVLHQLKHESRHQQVDVVFSHMNELPGYNEFKGVAPLSMQFSANKPLEDQLYNIQNTTKALTEYPSASFMQFLTFSQFIPVLSAATDKLLSELLLTGSSANTRVYLLTV